MSHPAPRRDIWRRFEPFTNHLHLVVPEIADDLDAHDDRHAAAMERIDKLGEEMRAELGRLKSISFGILVSLLTVAVGFALNLLVLLQ